MQAALDLDAAGATKLITETNSHNQKKGPSRYARVILGAYFGRPMLRYRLAIDVYLRFVALANVHLKADMSKTQNKEKILSHLKEKRHNGSCNKWSCTCLKDLGMTYLPNTSGLNSVLREAKKFDASGMLEEDESYKLLTLVMEQKATSDIQELRTENINWGPISNELNRSAKSLRTHYDCAIWTPLARILSDGLEAEARNSKLCQALLAEDALTWKRELCEAILAHEAVTERRGIRWPEMHDKFANVGPYAMLNFIGNCTKGKEGMSFRECLRSYLENPTSAAKSKSKLDFGVILEIYFNHREKYA